MRPRLATSRPGTRPLGASRDFAPCSYTPHGRPGGYPGWISIQCQVDIQLARQHRKTTWLIQTLAASACISERGNSCPPARPTWRPDRRKWRHRAHFAHVARCLPHAGSPQSPGSPASSSVRHDTGSMASLHHRHRFSWRWGAVGVLARARALDSFAVQKQD